MSKNKHAGGSITPVHYNPPSSHGLDLEIFPVSMLRRRASVDQLRTAERIQFHLLICVTEGHCTHMVDFEPIACESGSLLMLRPGQVQRFDTTTDWQGWLVLFRPEFLQPKEATALVSKLEIFHQLELLPNHLALNEIEQQAVVESITRMFQDAQCQSDTVTRHALLRSQLYAILIRLHLAQTHLEESGSAAPVLLQRFKLFCITMEREFHSLHRVADYAKLIC